MVSLMPLYFAYGSNMSARQMARRCPGARYAGPARLDGWRFIVTTRGTANIIPDRNASLHGVVWRCTPRHIASLDRYEGVSWRNYRRIVTRITDPQGTCITAVTYVSARRFPGRGRTQYFFTAVLPGAHSGGLPEDYQQELRRWLPARPVGERRNRYNGRRSGRV